MRTLKALRPAARVLLTEDFRKEDGGRVDASDFIAPASLGRTIEVDALADVLREAQRRFSDPAKSDAWLGPRVHATVRLTRREAADKTLWEFLTIVEFPEYVRWRWRQKDADTPIPHDRFTGHESTNALARLWWATELVRNGSDYSPAVAALSINRFYLWQKLNCIHHKVGAVAAVRFLSTFGEGGVNNEQALEMARALNLALRTISLDALAGSPAVDAVAVRDWIREKFDVTTMLGDELPVGPDEAGVPEQDVEAVCRFLGDLARRIDLGSKSQRRTGARGAPSGAASVPGPEGG